MTARAQFLASIGWRASSWSVRRPCVSKTRGSVFCFFFFQAEDGIRDSSVTGVQTCALPISTVLHHDEPASQLVGMADSAGCHLPSGSKVHLFHEYRVIGKMSASAISGDGSGRRIDDMKLLRTLAVVGSYRPGPQELICGSVRVGHMQISLPVGCGLGF